MTSKASSLDIKLERLGMWSGIAFAIFGLAAFFGSGIVPPLSAAVSPEVVVQFVVDHKFRILIGSMLAFIGMCTFMMTWPFTLGYQLRKYVNPSNLVFYVCIGLGIFTSVLALLFGLFGTAMAFRVSVLNPPTVQLLYDMLIFLILIPWPPYMLWQLLVGFAILSPTNTEGFFPRWTGYLSFWAGALEVFAAMGAYWYSGPFSYNGLMAFWVPGGCFFVWSLSLTICQIKNFSRVKDGLSATALAAPEVRAPAIDPAEVIEATLVGKVG